VSGAPRKRGLRNSPASGFHFSRSAIIHRTVRCAPDCPVCTGLSGVPAEQRLPPLQRLSVAHLMRALRAQMAGAPIPAHRTRNSRCPVCTGHLGGPTSQELQRLESNGSDDVAGGTGLSGVHRTVRCAPDCPVRHRADSLPTATFGGWGYKYPNHPTIHCIQVFHLSTTTRALAFNSRHTKRIKSSPTPLKPLVTSERDLPCSFELLRLDRFLSFSLVLVIKTQL
jgi:hypothetical protein